MAKRFVFYFPVLLLAIALVGCHKNKNTNPIANVDSKQPDKVLFDRSMEAMKEHKYDIARMTLQTLINTYPDSEYVARAKLAIGDSWYQEGGTAGLAQAEIEYKDFITFFPNMPEAAEAQLKVANIHYKQMEKPDRDYTHAKRAEEEYKQLLLQFPDSKLVAEAKQRLLEVQEVLAEREFRIGYFYYMRENYPASIARLQSMVDTYPLYSGADEALYVLGDIYEKQIARTRGLDIRDEALKGRIIQEWVKKAESVYDRLITRYPVTARANDAKARLEAMHLPVPTATAQAIAQNKAEEESRQEIGRFGKLMANFHRQPDTSLAAKVGEPTLVEPKQVSAPQITREATKMIEGTAAASSGAVTVETTGSSGTPGPNEPIPHSQPAASGTSGDGSSSTGEAPLPPPAQVNEAAPHPPAQVNEAAGSNGQQSSTTASSDSKDSKNDSKDDKNVSSSKKKGKKGIRKIIPF